MTSALITLAELIAAFGVASALCWAIDWWAQRKQADWTREGNARRW